MIVRQGIVSTIAQLIGRSANIVVPLIVVYRYGVSNLTDDLFLTMAVAFFFGGTLANSATDVFVPELLKRKSSYTERDWKIFSGIISVLSIVVVLTTSYESELSSMLLIVSAFVIVYCGICSSLYVAHFYSCGNFLLPGVSWSFRWISVIPIIAIDEAVLGILLFLLFTAIADLTRYFLLRACVNRQKMVSYTTSHGYEALMAVIIMMVSSSISGLNPLVDRLIASLLSPGELSKFEVIDRVGSVFLMLPTVGLLQVISLNVTVRIFKNENWRYDIFLLKILLFSTLWSFLCLFFVFSLSAYQEHFRPYFSIAIGSDQLWLFVIFIFSAPSMFLGMVLVRMLLAVKKGQLVLIGACISVVSNISMSLILSKIMGIHGILIATLVTYSLTFIFLLYYFSKVYRELT
ncbi:polysaccharide biosynthesis C-terminal domain-containing protein [Marinobacter sp. SS21]|uniref:polysaccharide biosynthesis C-terminal domain-containing protein n=1 Tax=Marinobacter sp. SS21 TaxID=2979460 RepID=UPI002330B62B|nr:polysaccharide biosynthesis C-terminal domain-containing protein [Marinobacter sp. SS21]MDC0661788.1 polysaccharide biosynthesis C-terminal domain-containing protein [Marinobacter sp. SS21]